MEASPRALGPPLCTSHRGRAVLLVSRRFPWRFRFHCAHMQDSGGKQQALCTGWSVLKDLKARWALLGQDFGECRNWRFWHPIAILGTYVSWPKWNRWKQKAQQLLQKHIFGQSCKNLPCDDTCIDMYRSTAETARTEAWSLRPPLVPTSSTSIYGHVSLVRWSEVLLPAVIEKPRARGILCPAFHCGQGGILATRCDAGLALDRDGDRTWEPRLECWWDNCWRQFFCPMCINLSMLNDFMTCACMDMYGRMAYSSIRSSWYVALVTRISHS